MNVDRALVEKIALLARLEVPPEDADRLVGQMGRIVALVETLGALDTGATEPLTNPSGTRDAFRPDEPRPCLPNAEALAGAPDAIPPFFKVPRVVE